MTKEALKLALEAGFDSAHLTRFAELVFEQGRQEGMKQERALWTLTKLGQEIEAQPERDPWREAAAQPERDPWREAAAQPEQKHVAWEQFHEHLLERNFCPRCGKRLGLGGIHTCTPPHDKT